MGQLCEGQSEKKISIGRDSEWQTTRIVKTRIKAWNSDLKN